MKVNGIEISDSLIAKIKKYFDEAKGDFYDEMIETDIYYWKFTKAFSFKELEKIVYGNATEVDIPIEHLRTLAYCSECGQNENSGAFVIGYDPDKEGKFECAFTENA